MNVAEVRKRVAVKIWCDPSWLAWLDGFARHENMTIPGIAAAALVRLAHVNNIQTCASICEQVRPTSQGYGVLIPRGHYSLYYWPSARAWIKSMAVTLNEGVGSLIERALAEHAEAVGYPPPPHRTRVRKCTPRI